LSLNQTEFGKLHSLNNTQIQLN